MISSNSKSFYNASYVNVFTEFIYLFILSVCLYNYTPYKINLIITINLFILFLTLYDIYFSKNKYSSVNIIEPNRKGIFIITYSLFFNLIVNVFFRIFIYSSYLLQIITPIFYIFTLIFMLHKFNIKITKFNYKTSLFWIISTFVAYFFIKKYADNTNINYNNILNFAIVLIINFFTNFGLEEIVFRGAGISGLSSFNLNSIQINIIQSLVFALSHYNLYNTNQLPYLALIGYLLGKLYLSSRSLTPSILFHGLYNFFL